MVCFRKKKRRTVTLYAMCAKAPSTCLHRTGIATISATLRPYFILFLCGTYALGVIRVIYTWICLDWCFFTDCTMVNHQETTIWDNSFGTFSKHFMQINPSIFDPWPKWKVEFSTKNSPNLVGAIQEPLAASLVAELRNTIKVLYPTERVLIHVCNLNQVCVVFHYFDKKVSATCCYMSSTKKGQWTDSIFLTTPERPNPTQFVSSNCLWNLLGRHGTKCPKQFTISYLFPQQCWRKQSTISSFGEQ